MKQRVGLARALATDADIMLMDEPFSALDPLIRRDMQDLLMRLHHDLERTIIFVTHDLNEAMRIGKRIMLMKDGELIQLGTGADILSNPADEYVSNFVADVDRMRVLTARDLMAEPPMVVRIGDDLSDVVRHLQQCGAEGAYVLDEGRLSGAITLKALKLGPTAVAATLEMAHLDTDFGTTRADTLLIDLCGLVLSQSLPLAVLDDDRRLLGTVSSKAILKAIATEKIGVRSHG